MQNAPNAFTIERDTGQLVVSNPFEIDFESESEHFLTIAVEDNGDPPRSATARVQIYILDENEYPSFRSAGAGSSTGEGAEGHKHGASMAAGKRHV